MQSTVKRSWRAATLHRAHQQPPPVPHHHRRHHHLTHLLTHRILAKVWERLYQTKDLMLALEMGLPKFCLLFQRLAQDFPKQKGRGRFIPRAEGDSAPTQPLSSSSKSKFFGGSPPKSSNSPETSGASRCCSSSCGCFHRLGATIPHDSHLD